MWKWEAEGQPKAVVAIVHNVYEHHSRYAWLIQRLRTSNFHVVMGDLPGHGEAAMNEVHEEKMTTYLEYVKKLLAVGIGDGLPLFVIGHGLGATLIARILQKEKIECAGVIMSSPWFQLQYHPPKYSSVLSKLGSTLMKLDHEIRIDLLTKNSDIQKEHEEDPYYNSKISASWYRDLQNFMKTVLNYEGPIQDVPVLLHAAEEDQITEIEFAQLWIMNQKTSELQYKKWKRMYHDVYQEVDREEVFLYTESFMDGVLRSLGYVV